MGLMVDTNVIIRFEKSGKPIDFSSWESSQKVYISAVLEQEVAINLVRTADGLVPIPFNRRRFRGTVCRW